MPLVAPAPGAVAAGRQAPSRTKDVIVVAVTACYPAFILSACVDSPGDLRSPAPSVATDRCTLTGLRRQSSGGGVRSPSTVLATLQESAAVSLWVGLPLMRTLHLTPRLSSLASTAATLTSS